MGEGSEDIGAQQVLSTFQVESEFALLLRDVEFQQSRADPSVFVCLLMHFDQQIEAVHLFDICVEVGYLAYFVLLQVPYEVPLYVFGQGIGFREELLYFVFGKQALTLVVERQDIFRRAGLGNGGQLCAEGADFG